MCGEVGQKTFFAKLLN